MRKKKSFFSEQIGAVPLRDARKDCARSHRVKTAAVGGTINGMGVAKFTQCILDALVKSRELTAL